MLRAISGPPPASVCSQLRGTSSPATSCMTTKTPASIAIRGRTTPMSTTSSTATATMASTTPEPQGRGSSPTPSTRTRLPVSTWRGTRPGVTIANNISVDNGINSPRSHGNILGRCSSTPGTTIDFDLLYLSTPDKLLVWARRAICRSRRSDPQPAGKHTAFRPTRNGSTHLSVTSTSAPARLPSTLRILPRADNRGGT